MNDILENNLKNIRATLEFEDLEVTEATVKQYYDIHYNRISREEVIQSILSKYRRFL
ncbi:hypothetical protein QUF55_05435 [Clostridiaceae bacterium HSG29]|nr:hypothetical protein [Clostridiaceae bacterium HSG29]